MTTFPIITLGDGTVSDPQWFADITDAVNQHQADISTLSGLLGGTTGVTNPAVTSGSDTTTSSSFVNMAGTGAVTSFPFPKQVATTRLIVWMMGGWQNATAVSDMSYGVLVNGTDYELDRQSLNATTTVGKYIGFALITGLAIATYTIQGRWKRRSGGGTPTRSSAEWLAISCTEIN